MNNKKTTKRALLSSVLSLVLCMAMLIGTTFAWFTDSVTSKNNIIKSGNLDVTMEWKDATPTGKQDTYQDASKGAIFNYELWEPGYVEAKNIKISNVGTLALKYHLNIAVNGEVSALADVIDVYFAEGEYTLASRDMTELTKVGTLRDILDGMPANMSGALEANTYDVVTIALKMQESAGNEYQGLSIGSDFSVVLMATQDNVESDSFDENYDDIEIPDKDIKVIDGNTYYYCGDGNVVLVTVPYGNVGSTFAMREDVTILGRGDTYAEGKPVFSKSSPIETITLNEGLKEIKARAITGVKTLTSINFPSSLEIIGVQSLAQSGMTDLRIPATVKEIKYGAFTASPKLTTVTIEGNTRLDNYVFRDCNNLESIYLLGDDVQFVGGGMFATNKQSGDANGITIYVKNATVAARLYAAQSSAYGYEVKILGDNADGSDASDVVKAANNTQLDAAIVDGASTVVLGNGNYIIPDSAQGKTLTIAGNGNTVIATQDDGSYEGCDYSLDGATVTFEGVVINSDSTTYTGYSRCKATYNNCTINGAYWLYDESTFNNCTFNVTGDNYNLWTWGGKVVKFNDCTFNCDGKSILVYTASCDVYFDGCIFNDRTGGTGFTKSAIETGTDAPNLMVHNIYITDTTVNGFAENDKCVGYKNIVGNKNSLSTEHLNIVVDGVDVY